MKYITKSLIFIALCSITFVLSSYTVYGHNSRNIRGYSGYNYYGQIKNYRQDNNYRRSYRDYYYSNKKDYGIYRRFNRFTLDRFTLGYRYRPYRYRRYDCR